MNTQPSEQVNTLRTELQALGYEVKLIYFNPARVHIEVRDVCDQIGDIPYHVIHSVHELASKHGYTTTVCVNWDEGMYLWLQPKDAGPSC